MSITTVVGFLVGIALFLGAILISTDNVLMFLSLSSFVMVVGGTLANAFISYQGPYVLQALRSTWAIFAHAETNETILIAESKRIIDWGKVVASQGQTALENQFKAEGQDAFLQYGIRLVIDGHGPDTVRDFLTNRIESMHQRAMRPVAILKNMASTAPAFGMIGTLVGLVIMLDGLGSDPGKLGTGLAMAMLTTLYGVLIARLVFQPAGDKTLQRQQILRFRNHLMMEGFVMLAEMRTAAYIRDRIASFLPPSVVEQWESSRNT
jgi:chemotaxis protein MotA